MQPANVTTLSWTRATAGRRGARPGTVGEEPPAAGVAAALPPAQRALPGVLAGLSGNAASVAASTVAERGFFDPLAMNDVEDVGATREGHRGQTEV